jgi:hypothetical protein
MFPFERSRGIHRKHLNFTLSDVGPSSVGSRGAHIGVTARGQRYTSVGLPGTGLS